MPEAAAAFRLERKPDSEIKTPAGLSRGRKFSDPDISQIPCFNTQAQVKFSQGGFWEGTAAGSRLPASQSMQRAPYQPIPADWPIAGSARAGMRAEHQTRRRHHPVRISVAPCP
jgi:hypothetical protein